MLSKPLLHNWTLRIVLILLLLAFGFYFIIRPALNEQELTRTEIAEIPDTQQFPEEITPEGVVALMKESTPFLLINADDASFQIPSSPGPARLIYYTTTPSFRSAQKLVRKDRESKPTSFLDAIKINSQRLTGTPLEWLRLDLAFLNKPSFTQPLLISPRQLSEAVKDGVDLQMIDIRPAISEVSEASPFPQAFRWLPQEISGNLAKLSKEKWIVMIGNTSEEVQPIAWELFQKGYPLVTILDGGYPAWENATDR